MPFWTVILLAGRMAIPQELYEAAEVDGATGLRRFIHVSFPLMANLYLVCTLLSTIFTLGDFNTAYFISGGGPALSTHVLATLGIRDAFEIARPQLGVAAVLSALPLMIPLVILLMHKLRTSEVQFERGHGRPASQEAELPRPANYRRNLGAGARAVLAIWTLAPLYNMFMVALESHNDVFSTSIWPTDPSPYSFWIVFTEGYWYLEYFWHQYANSIYIGFWTVFLTLWVRPDVLAGHVGERALSLSVRSILGIVSKAEIGIGWFPTRSSADGQVRIVEVA